MALFQDLHLDGDVARRLRRHGWAGLATITSASKTGLTVDGLEVFDLDLDVALPGYPVYTVSHRQALAPQQSAPFAVGVTLEARVDADRPSVLILL